MFIRSCVLLISCSIVITSSLSSLENPEDSGVSFRLVKNVCPNKNKIVTTSDFPSHDRSAEFNGTNHCMFDEQCKIGSKCCPVDEFHSACVDLIDMTLSKSKLLTTVTFKRKKRSRKPRIFFWQIFSAKTRPCSLKCSTNDDCFEFKGGARKAVYNCVYTSYYPYKCAHCQYAFSIPPGGQSFSIKI